MDKSLQTVRLIGVVLMSGAAAWFVRVYSLTVSMRMEVVHDARAFSPACHFFLDYGWVGFALPLLVAAFGICTIVKQRWVLHESLLALASVLTVAWVMLAVVVWELAQIPVFSGGQWHY